LAQQELPDLPSYPPQIEPMEPAAYRLQVDGAVTAPAHLSLEQLQELPHVTVTGDFTCLEGWVVRDRSWQGVPLAAVLERAGLLPEVRYVAVYAADHDGEYNVLLGREQALAPTSLLAFQKDGKPLSHGHGAPVRLQVPGADCFTQVKWVVRLEARTEPVAARGKEIALERLRQMQKGGAR
jgi:DMSO/TMAO reductase YedYZ molybdopterin-dependent catalytic subunit